MENLWEATSRATRYMKAIYSRCVRMTDDEWLEFMDEVELLAVRQFLNVKIRGRQYRRDQPFFNNVFSCVMSTFARKLNLYLKFIIKPKINSLEHLNDAHSMIVTNGEFEWHSHNDWQDLQRYTASGLPRYMNVYDNGINARKNLRHWLQRRTDSGFVRSEDEGDFWTYLEACDEFDITVNRNSRVYRNSMELENEKLRRF